MNPYFKVYLKNAAVGGLAGATFGAVCGSGAGVAGINQMCSGHMNTRSCDNLVSYSEGEAASAGATAGAAIGFALGITFYPAYKALLGLCSTRTSREVSPDNLQLSEARVALSV